MKIRSQTELQDCLDSSLKDRKKELSTLRFMIDGCKRDHERNVLLRAAIPILYAHWEGFIKFASVAYLTYILHEGITFDNLKPTFKAVALRNKVLAVSTSKKLKPHQELIEFIFENLDKHVAFNPKTAIDTESNLSSTVLQDIMQTIDLNFDSEWQKKIQIIDRELIKNRNDIVHGELVPVDQALFQQLHKFVIESLEKYKTSIENAVLLRMYKVTT